MSAQLRQWRNLGLYSDFDGQRIFVRESGDVTRPALLMLHGFPTAGFDWHRMWDELGIHFHLIAPDLLGFGFSSKPDPHTYTITGQADLIEKVLREREIQRVHILAHDLGDSVAQELLARHEHRAFLGDDGLRLASICFLNGGLFPEAHRPRPIQRLLASPLGFLFSGMLNRRRFGRSFRAVFGAQTQPRESEVDDCWALIAHDGGQRIAHRLLAYIAERRLQRNAWVGAMQTTRVPLRLVNGTADPVSGATLVKRYRDLMSVPDVFELPGIGHYPQLEAPLRVLVACRSFWTRIGALSK